MKNIMLMVSSAVFAIVAALHLLRAVYGLPILISDFSFPVWASYPAAAFAAAMAVLDWKYGRRKEAKKEENEVENGL